MYQNFTSRIFSNESGIIVLVNWPRAHCGGPKLTEASSLGPDSPRMSPRKETAKQGRRQMTVANYAVQRPSWTWCRKWWNHSWHNCVTLNQRCFAFICPRTPLVYRYHVISRTQSHGAVFGCASLFDSWVTSVLYWLDWICTGRAAQILRQKQSLDSGIWSQNNEHCRGLYSTPLLTQCTKTITRLVSNKKYCIWIKHLNVRNIFKRVLAKESNHCLNGEITAEAHTVYTTVHRSIVHFRYFRI